MVRLGLPRNCVKPRAAAALERLGRLKLNGSLTSYNELSRFSELEFLVMGIEGKKQLWNTLANLAGLSTLAPGVDFDGLIARAEVQRSTLEPHRVAAGRKAFVGASEPRVPVTDEATSGVGSPSIH